MTDIQISQLVDDVINGKENPVKAGRILHKIRNLHHTPIFVDECIEEVRKLIVKIDLPYAEYKSQWVRATDGFDYTINSLDNRSRDYRNSIDHF